jgi:hypothetical protein
MSTIRDPAEPSRSRARSGGRGTGGIQRTSRRLDAVRERAVVRLSQSLSLGTIPPELVLACLRLAGEEPPYGMRDAVENAQRP